MYDQLTVKKAETKEMEDICDELLNEIKELGQLGYKDIVKLLACSANPSKNYAVYDIIKVKHLFQ